MALFLAALEQWRGWVVPTCREELLSIGARYGLSERRLMKSLKSAHRNIESLRRDWQRPRPWTPTSDFGFDLELSEVAGPAGTYGVRGLAAGRFLFHRGNARWEWRSSLTHFDDFCQSELDVDLDEIRVLTDDTTFELLSVTVEAHDSSRQLTRADPD